MIYSKKLIDLRESKNLKQYELAQLLGLSPSTYNNYETEYEIMSINYLNKLCNYFKVSIDYLFELTSKTSYKNIKNNINNTNSGMRLKELRKINNLNQTEFAKIVGINQTTVSVYELKKVVISTSTLYAICKKYNMSADYLLGKIDYIPDWCIKKNK